ncbi:hypothetical protein N7507_008879 [Penicillium longicatenatum]|nr:hypothetical protein N7507_008879 [Penicillium longicatenatum]
MRREGGSLWAATILANSDQRLSLPVITLWTDHRARLPEYMVPTAELFAELATYGRKTYT